MSLRAFHLVFVTATTLLSLFLVIWAFGFSGESSVVSIGLGVIGILGLLGMPAYGIYFYRKAKNILL
jgi:hypothetical protein